MNHALLARIQSAEYNPSLTLAQAVDRYLNGESMQVLAKEFGCSRSVLYRWMMNKAGGHDSWRELKKAAIIHRIAIADDNLDGASTHEDIARAREQCRFARMDYERLCPQEYGPKVEHTLTGPASISLGLSAPVTQHIVDVTPHNPSENVSDCNVTVNPFD